MPEETTTLQANVHGRVQGVGFRFFVIEEANRLGLHGWVRNQPDGTVEVFAEGPESKLHSLLEKLRRGPIAARVENVHSHFDKAEPRHSGFQVKY